MRFQPLVKWIGSKRGQSEEILKYFPENIDTYYEPFCGGCSVAYQLLSSDTHFVNKVVCSDINGDLVEAFCAVRDNPHRVINYLKQKKVS